MATAYVVVAWLLIQVAETLFPLFGFDETPARIVVILLAIGFFPAMVFAWAFEITPEGLKRERDVVRSDSVTGQTAKKLDRAIIVVLALALLYFAVDKFILDPQREATQAEYMAEQVEQARHEGRSQALVESYGDKSIAVLAFEDMSPNKDQEYLSDGIAEELLNLLAKVPELRVISRSSAFSYKGKDVKLAEIADELNVGHVLEGSVRKAGDQVRITAQLIEARSDTHLWSETYDRTLSDIFAIQDEIAEMVVRELKIALLGETPDLVQTDPELYTVFLQARHLRRQVSESGLSQAEELLEQVISSDPGYLPALDDLITVYINQVHIDVRDFDEGYRRARELALRGLETDPEFGRMYAQMGWIAMFYTGDMQAAASYFEQGIALAPGDATMLGDTSTLLFLLGRTEEAILMMELATRMDPLNTTSWFNYGQLLASASRWDESVTSLKTALRLSPDSSEGHYYLALSLLGSGEPGLALDEIALEPESKRRLLGEAMIYPALRRDEKADTSLSKLIENGADPLHIAQVYAARGDFDDAFAWIEKSVAESSLEIAAIHVNPWFNSLKSDARWDALMERLGKSPAQLESIKFELPIQFK